MGNDRYKHLTDDERQTPDLLLLRAALDASRAELERVRGPDWKSWKDRCFKIDKARQKVLDDLRAQLAAGVARIGEITDNTRRLEQLFITVMPEVFECPDCGPFARVDEDECCAVCWADCDVVPTHLALVDWSRALTAPAAEATPLTPSPPPCQVCGRPWVRYPDGSWEWLRGCECHAAGEEGELGSDVLDRELPPDTGREDASTDIPRLLAALRAVWEKAAELQPYEGQDYDGGWIDAMDEIRAAIEREIGRGEG